MSSISSPNARPAPDELLTQIANYVCDFEITSREAYETARYCLMDTLGCGILALNYPACTKLLGPIVPGTIVPNGSRVPGTNFELDPVLAAFNIGCIIRWLDFNDTWLAAEWGHPSDNLGGILAVADFVSRNGCSRRREKPDRKTDSPVLPPHVGGYTMHDVLTAMIKAHEIQGILALQNSFNRVGLDHVILVRIASTAVVTQMLGGTREQIINAISNAWLDGGALRTYRHAPNTGSRKSWAAGDATARAVQHAFMAIKGEMGYPSALSTKGWGFQDVLFRGQEIKLSRPLGSYVIEHVLFKIAFPAEFHAQTAVEAAFKLHPLVKDRFGEIEKISLHTHESAIRIIDKSGPLHNPADRDHCLQYMMAIGLLFGELTADHYEDKIARDLRVDALRAKMVVQEESRYSQEYLEPEKRSIANAIQIFFTDGTATEKIEVEYPTGHRRRRQEAIPLLLEKFKTNLATKFSDKQVEKILQLCSDTNRLQATSVSDFVKQFVLKEN